MHSIRPNSTAAPALAERPLNDRSKAVRGLALIALAAWMSLSACGCHMPLWPSSAAAVNDPFVPENAAEPSVEIVDTNPSEFARGL
jgi:hypothetical protein